MDDGELGAFLRSRRARLKPEDVGLVSYGVRRRVPGLRREELAQLAGVSVAYYTRLEQGQSRNASAEVLDAIARALRLDDTEQAHLRDLARPVRAKRRTPRPESVRPRLRHLLDSMDAVPALVIGRRNDVLAWNRLGHALLAGHLEFGSPNRVADQPSLSRMLFLDPHTRELYPQWTDEARGHVAYLRLVAGRFPDDPLIAGLIGELSMKSPEFAELWGRRRVRDCTYGCKQLRHPLVGPLELEYQALQVPDQQDQRLELFTAEPGSPSEAALRLLGTSIGGAAKLPASLPG
ncbi:helix-turn-helix domain-containing protein [Saccharopolyspora elongata]|uniref:XRE family transcriptional regulator n=1 Tax=Saccharopolyspora elongata TaxID=2530387 RepID=A0A4R4YYI0_9PSEU|nr:helix-turn-helix transcriptional regulator [Saccharopolyspora elongata]TDD50588.1 XRE family transcriptional regulator [Saccharopolyspora elongata]